MNAFIQQGCIQSDSKDCYIKMIFQLSIQRRIIKTKYVSQFTLKYWAAQLFWTLIIIRNIYWTENQHIRMISEGSCDTEDWVMMLKIHSSKLHFEIYLHRKQLF